MIEEGLILHFKQFHFKNGSPSKSKYFIVLKKANNNLIIASLPSSKDFVPSHWQRTSRCECIEIAEASFNCFLFVAGLPVTNTGWCFAKDTYLYGQQIDDYELQALTEKYPIQGIDFDIIGKLTDELLTRIIDCLKASASVKRRFKRMM